MDLNTLQEIECAIEALTPHHSRPVDAQLKTDRLTDRNSVVAEMRALRSRIKPDPEGWTTRDYVNYGRH